MFSDFSPVVCFYPVFDHLFLELSLLICMYNIHDLYLIYVTYILYILVINVDVRIDIFFFGLVYLLPLFIMSSMEVSCLLIWFDS